MLSKGVKQSLVIGIGNPLRSDDGVGPCIVANILEKNIRHVKVVIAHQLNIELLEEVVEYDNIVMIDASLVGEGLVFRKIQPSESEQVASSHHLTPEFFSTLAKKLYHRDLNLYLCSIRGRNFDLGNELSEDVKAIVPKAVEEIVEFLMVKN